MVDLGDGAFDADNHYYEALDAFTRHLDPSLGDRCVQWAQVGGRRYHVVGGVLSKAVANPTFDPVAKAGAMHDYFRGNPDGRDPLSFLTDREPCRPEYRDRDARLARMDEFGLASVWMFPTLGVLYEELLKRDPEAVTLTFTAFNRWLDEDWGLARDDRIISAPYLSLCDVDWACRELEWALDAGARIICLRPAAPWTETGPKPPTDPMFDPFWARVNEAGITVVAHAGDSGHALNGYDTEGFATDFKSGFRPTIKFFSIERAALDFFLTLQLDKLFDRFPNLRFASVENGSEYLPDLERKLRSIGKKVPGWFTEDPMDTFRRHVWVNPFWEDDPRMVTDIMGADRVIFGSDWPHIEGMPRPLDYVDDLADFSDAERRMILKDNTTELSQPRPA